MTAWIFALGVAGQGVLGWLLAEDDFGAFAIAIGLGSLVYALRDGRVGSYLLERGPYASPNVPANAVWYSLAASVLAALSLALTAPVGGWVFDEPAVRSVLLISAGAVPLGFFVPIANGILQNHGRIRTAEMFNVGAIVVHHSLVALFAALGLGAVSFVLPLLITNPLFSLAGWLAVRGLRVPFGRSSYRGIIRIGRRSHSILVALAALGLLRHGHLAALGLGASIEVVGFYYFAYQLVMGSALWLTSPVRWVLVPTFASMHGDQWRRRRAALDAFLVGSLLIGTVPLLLGALARPLEAVVWRGRWEEAVPAIQVFGVVAALEVLVVVALMLFESSAPIRRRIELVGGRGIGLVLVMALAGWLAPDGSPGAIAVA
ncbi:MAG: oligosaccharide flippase family protein, partial [Anaerolineae bacterium]|nr:oligosaccharide flippase family protein [Anaerolineae bacterium]